MAFIIDPDSLSATEVSVDINARTFTLNAAGNLNDPGSTAADNGVTGQAIYSYFKEEWRECTEYNTTATVTGSSTIAFVDSNPDTITSSAEFAPVPSVGDKILIVGSASNDGAIYTVAGTPTASSIEVEEEVVAEGAGTSTTILILAEDYLIQHPFPVLPLTREQYEWGNNGSQFNGWRPSADATRNFLRTCGWAEYDANGVLLREYAGIITLGGPEADDQVYYENQVAVATDFNYVGVVNEGVQIFGNVDNGNFTRKTLFNVFVREAGQIFNASSIGDIGVTTMENIVNRFPLATAADPNYDRDADFNIGNAPWNAMTITYYNSAQPHTIDSVSYDFHVEVDGAAADRYDIYTFLQYQQLTGGNIDDLGGFTIEGKTSQQLAFFDGTTLVTNYVDETAQEASVAGGTIILNFDNNDKNDIKFTDDTQSIIAFNFVAAGLFDFNTNLENDTSGRYWAYFDYTYTEQSTDAVLAVPGTGAEATLTGSSYLFQTSDMVVGDQIRVTGFTDPENNGVWQVVTINSETSIEVDKIRDEDGVTTSTPIADAGPVTADVFYNPFGTTSAVLVQDSLTNDITGDIDAADTISWDFAFDGNVQGGRTAAVNANCIAVAIGLDTAQYIRQPFTISRATGISVALNANRERVYST